jgi:hypothetical protein
VKVLELEGLAASWYKHTLRWLGSSLELQKDWVFHGKSSLAEANDAGVITLAQKR